MRERLANCKYFSIALDESTDNVDTAQLLVFVRAVNENCELTQDLAGMASLTGRTTGKDIFGGVNSVLENLKVLASKLASVTTDGAPAMTGKASGFVAHLLSHLQGLGIPTDSVHLYHCLIHQEALCARILKFDNVMKFVFTSVNFIRARGLNHGQFRSFLEDIEAEYRDIPYHTDVRWLSRGKVLKRFVELRKEICEFLTDKGKDTALFSDKQWLADLAFLTYITDHLNKFNQCLQGKDHFIFDMYQELQSFTLKLRLFSSNLQSGNLCHFPTCSDFQKEYQCDFSKYHCNCETLLKEFSERFDAFKEHKDLFNFIRDPFTCDVESVPDRCQLEVIDLQCSPELKSSFQQNNILTFYGSLSSSTYRSVKDLACKLLSEFGSTYLCEQTFSIMNMNKNELRSNLTDNNLCSILRLATTKLEPNVDKVVDSIQAHPSH